MVVLHHASGKNYFGVNLSIKVEPEKNIASDLFMEHLNRTLKDYLKGLGVSGSEWPTEI